MEFWKKVLALQRKHHGKEYVDAATGEVRYRYYNHSHRCRDLTLRLLIRNHVPATAVGLRKWRKASKLYDTTKEVYLRTVVSAVREFFPGHPVGEVTITTYTANQKHTPRERV